MSYLKISIVLPTYNSEKYVEGALKSIINQEYPNLELIVVDNCSTDNTINIFKKYTDKINILIVENDEGPYHAVKYGLELASGDIIAWLNSDDIYFQWTFSMVNRIFTQHSHLMWIGGIPSQMDENGILYGMNNTIPSRPQNAIKNGWFYEKMYGYLQQEGMFWRKEVYQNSNGLNTKYKLAADFDLWTQFAQKYELVSVGMHFASFRIHDNSRSRALRNIYEQEILEIIADKKKPTLIKRYLFGINKNINGVLRKFVWKKSLVYYFSLRRKKWLLKYKYTSISPNPFSHILLN